MHSYLCRRRRRWCLRLLRNTVCRVQISCRRCRRYSVLCIQWPLALPGGKAHCSRPSCGFSDSPPCSFVLKCSGTCQTTRVIAGKTHSQSPILKCYGVLSNPVICAVPFEFLLVGRQTSRESGEIPPDRRPVRVCMMDKMD